MPEVLTTASAGAIVPVSGRGKTDKEENVGIAILLLILALIIGGVGLFVEALQWLLIIALVLLVIGAITGARGRRGGAPPA